MGRFRGNWAGALSSVCKSAAVLAVSTLIGLAASAPASAINIVNGDCNIIIQNVEVGDGTLEIPEAGCNQTRPEDSFRVRYFWLDSLSLSFLMAGYADENLQQIAGRSPQMWRGSIYPVLSEILDRFGDRPGPNSKLLYPGYTARILTRGGTAEITPSAISKKFPRLCGKTCGSTTAFIPFHGPISVQRASSGNPTDGRQIMPCPMARNPTMFPILLQRSSREIPAPAALSAIAHSCMVLSPEANMKVTCEMCASWRSWSPTTASAP